MAKTAITPTRADDYPEWYQQVIKAADLAENSDVRGCMVIKPWGWAHLGEHAAGAGRHVQGHGARERLFPAVHPAELPAKGGRPRRGFCQRMRGRHASPAGARAGWQAGPRSGLAARRAADRAADERNDHRRDVCQVGRVVSRPADPHQPMGQRRPLGAAHAAVPADDRVPLARRAHGPRHGRGGPGRDDEDARRLCRLRRELDGDAGHPRRKDRRRAVSRARSTPTRSKR